MQIQRVTKSSGITQEYDPSKISVVVKWACQGTNIDPEPILEELEHYLYDGITTADIQHQVVKIAASKISQNSPDYQYVAARLELFDLRKRVYGQYEPPSLLQHIRTNVQRGVYDPVILEKWTPEQIVEVDRVIDHEKDLLYSFAGMMQLKQKYLVKDRSTGDIFETPQMAIVLIAMCLHEDEPLASRLKYVREFYEVVSDWKLSLPTPIMAGVRTPTRQFSSCVLIESGDSLDSINATSSAIVKYISKRAGIGVNGGGIRAEGSRIRGGEIKHTGCIPFWKYFQTAVKSCSQGGVRGGAATIYYPMWHLEVEKLLVLKNNKGVEENRIRHMDYGITINKIMYERLQTNSYITLFSPDVYDGELYQSYFEGSEGRFRELYEKAESDPSVRKKRIKASEAFSLFLFERANTGRIYPVNIDNVNDNSPFKDPIKQSNLCLEIGLPTEPLKHINSSKGEIALCTLAAYNLGAMDMEDIPKVSRVATRALDNLLDYQDYPVKAAEKAKLRRSLGIGVTNFAYFLAKNFTNYNDEYARKLVHKTFEAIQYHLLDASAELAEERGACGLFDRTTYADGVLPIDRYKKTVDELVEPNYLQDWEALREKIKHHGLRHSTLTALMPCESSSQVTNSTNGIEPPRGLISVKGSKDGVFNQVVPEIETLAGEYQTAWQMVRENGNKGYLTLVAIMQKFVDQLISANTYYDPSNYVDGKVPLQELVSDLAFTSYYGVKSLYYHNTRDGADGTEEFKEEACDSCNV